MPDQLSFWYSLLLSLVVLAALFNVAQAVYPRLSWELTKWRYRDPDAVEPSRIVFAFRRVKALVGVAVFGGSATLLFTVRDDVATMLGSLP